jgi:hypothetical protein
MGYFFHFTRQISRQKLSFDPSGGWKGVCRSSHEKAEKEFTAEYAEGGKKRPEF